MESDYLSNQKAYILAMSENLSNLSNPSMKPISDELKATIRTMPAWGQYPWRRFEDISVETTRKAALRFLIQLPMRVLISIAYLLIKYFLYLPYRSTSVISANQNKLSFFSPCIHLEEFLDPQVLGFWGEVKYLKPRLKSEATWFLIPYKPPGISHKQVARKLSSIREKSSFSIFPIAALFDLSILSKACVRVVQFHHYAGVCAVKTLLSAEEVGSLRIIDVNNLGAGIARVELNNRLVGSALSTFETGKYVFHLMEGQSWEIALNQHAKGLDKKTVGVIHTPLRKQDSQILNYLIHGRDEVVLAGVEKILCPNLYSVKYLEDLGVSSSKLQLVEAQRFSHPATISQHSYSRGSKKILYVADASSVNSDYFQHHILQHLDTTGLETLEVYLQSHPGGTPILSNAIKSWVSGRCSEWGLVVFGPETSAYLQPEFANSNVRIFKPQDLSPQVSIVGAPEIPTIEDCGLLLESILNPFVLGEKGGSLMHRDFEFPKWRKVIEDAFQS